MLAANQAEDMHGQHVKHSVNRSSLSDLMLQLLEMNLNGQVMGEQPDAFEAWLTNHSHGVDFVKLFQSHVRLPQCLPVREILDAIGVTFIQHGSRVTYTIISDSKLPERVRITRKRVFEAGQL